MYDYKSFLNFYQRFYSKFKKILIFKEKEKYYFLENRNKFEFIFSLENVKQYCILKCI